MLNYFTASETDVSVVFALLRQLWTTEQRSDGLLRTFSSKLVQSPVDHIILAKNDTDIVGILVFSVFNSHWLGGHFAYLHALVIDEPHRGKGFGRDLLDYLANHLRSQGIVGIELDSGFHRHAAHTFYEKTGFERVSYLYTKKLSP